MAGERWSVEVHAPVMGDLTVVSLSFWMLVRLQRSMGWKHGPCGDVRCGDLASRGYEGVCSRQRKSWVGSTGPLGDCESPCWAAMVAAPMLKEWQEKRSAGMPVWMRTGFWMFLEPEVCCGVI